MAELIDVMDAFSTPLKLAWGVWLTWGVAQIFWYRHERQASARPARPSPPARAVAAPRASAAARPATGTRTPPAPEPIAPVIAAPVVEPAPEAVTPEGGAGPMAGEWEPTEAAMPGPNPADTFDPSRPVIETFSAQGRELDSFVASLNGGESAPGQDRPAWPEG